MLARVDRCRARRPGFACLSERAGRIPALLAVGLAVAGDGDWRADMWGQIVALHGRYPRALAPLKEQWWTDAQHTDTLCALACWRAQIDESSVDPREELSLQAQLIEFGHLLRQEGGGVAKAWKPGAAPDEWTRD